MPEVQAAEDQLDKEHDEIVESHRNYLEKIQKAFDARCDEIGVATEKKLTEIPESDQEKRKEILTEEQQQLDQALAELKQVVNRRDADVRKKLEDIEKKRDESAMDLEAELAKIV